MRATRIAAAALLAALWSVNASALVISLVPPDVNPTEGDTFNIDLVVGDIPSGELISGFEFGIGFDTSLVSFAGAAFTNALGLPNESDNLFDWTDCLFAFADDACAAAFEEFGAVTVLNLSNIFDPFLLEAIQSDPALYDDEDRLMLATLSFDSLGPGDAAFSLCPNNQYGSPNIPGVAAACEVKDFFGFNIPGGELVDTIVTIEERPVVVPEPGTLALFALGLLSVGLMNRRTLAARI